MKRKTGRRMGYRRVDNSRLRRWMPIRILLSNSTKNRNLKNNLESSRLRHQKEKYNLLQKLKTMLSTFKDTGALAGKLNGKPPVNLISNCKNKHDIFLKASCMIPIRFKVAEF